MFSLDFYLAELPFFEKQYLNFHRPEMLYHLLVPLKLRGDLPLHIDILHLSAGEDLLIKAHPRTPPGSTKQGQSRK